MQGQKWMQLQFTKKGIHPKPPHLPSGQGKRECIMCGGLFQVPQPIWWSACQGFPVHPAAWGAHQVDWDECRGVPWSQAITSSGCLHCFHLLCCMFVWLSNGWCANWLHDASQIRLVDLNACTFSMWAQSCLLWTLTLLTLIPQEKCSYSTISVDWTLLFWAVYPWPLHGCGRNNHHHQLPALSSFSLVVISLYSLLSPAYVVPMIKWLYGTWGPGSCGGSIISITALLPQCKQNNPLHMKKKERG